MSDVTAHPCDPVELRRLNFQTPAMMSHPPIPIAELANHTDRLKANDNLKFSHEYEASPIFVLWESTFDDPFYLKKQS